MKKLRVSVASKRELWNGIVFMYFDTFLPWTFKRLWYVALLSSEVEIPIRDDPDYPGDQESLLAADNLSTSIRVRVSVTDFNEPHTVQIQPRDTWLLMMWTWRHFQYL